MPIPLIKPYLPPGTEEKVREVLDSGYLTEGPVTREFEQAVADYVGVLHAIAVTSCTTGLELALRALGIGRGDEVIAPAYTHPGTVAVVNIVGARIVLVDIDPDTMLIDYDAVEEALSERTKAILPVSQFGNPLNYDCLNALKEKHKLYIVEDAACALGAEFKGQKTGAQADISVFSLHPRKFITTGEGGIVTTGNADWAHWMASYKHFGMDENVSRRQSCFERIGTNYKLSNLQAALGVVQMHHIDELLSQRQVLARRYSELLQEVPGITLPSVTGHGKHSYQTFCVLVDERDAVMQALRSRGIEAQIGTYALHRHPAYAESEFCRHAGNLENSDYAFDHCLALPLFHEMTEEQQDCVVAELKRAVNR